MKNKKNKLFVAFKRTVISCAGLSPECLCHFGRVVFVVVVLAIEPMAILGIILAAFVCVCDNAA